MRLFRDLTTDQQVHFLAWLNVLETEIAATIRRIMEVPAPIEGDAA